MINLCDHFSFSSIPFLRIPKIPFQTVAFSENLELLSSVFYTRQMAAVIGSSGSGKSSLLFYATNKLEPSSHRIVSSELSNPNKKALYKVLAIKCGLSPSFYTDDIKLQLIDFFDSENKQGKLNSVIMDEAHSLSIPILSEIRSFYEEAKNFSLILAGLPTLFSDTLSLSVNLPLKRRIGLIINIDTISLAQTKEYISHHLLAAKAKNSVFDEKCFPLIHSLTNGIPGKIDQLCYASILETFKNKTAIVSEHEIRACAEKIDY